MGKLKTVLILLLAAAVIVGCAYLPGFVGTMQDNAENEVRYAEIQALQLQLGNAQRGELPMLGKLSLLKRGTTMEIAEEDAPMLPDTVLDRSHTEFSRYMDCGLIHTELDFSKIWATPFLVFSPEDPDVNFIYWSVEVLDSSVNTSLTLLIDDETGKLLRIDYYTDEWYYAPEEQYYLLDTFYNVYMESLDLIEELKAREDAVSDRETFTEDISTDGSAGIRVRFSDPEYGEVNLDFYVHPNGFYCYFYS